MAALVVLAAIAAAFVFLLGAIVAVSWTINHVDRRGSLRDEQAPTRLVQGVLALTGAHAARWDRPGRRLTAVPSGLTGLDLPVWTYRLRLSLAPLAYATAGMVSSAD